MADGTAARLDDFGGGYSSCPGSAATPTATPTPPGGLLRVVVGPSESATGAETPTPTSTPMPWTVTPTPTPTFEPMATPTSVAHRASKVLAKPAQQGAGPSVCAKYDITSQDCVATTYYNFGSQRVAMRVQSDVRNDVYWLHSDHLGSASLTTDASGSKVAEMRFKPWGEVRWSSGAMPTDRQFTGMTTHAALGGLVTMGVREYLPTLGRWLSADAIVPRAGNPQALNRYSHVFNRSLVLTDPSGHDPVDKNWEKEFYKQHGHLPTQQDIRDRLFSVIFRGSNKDGSWSDKDWARYSANRRAFWEHPESWSGETPGRDTFVKHVQTLASNYKSNEISEFVAAIGFVWGAIPYESVAIAIVEVATNQNGLQQEFPYLGEGNEGWNSSFVEPRDNVSHHYAGYLYSAYFFGPKVASGLNWHRDGRPNSPAGINQPDLQLGSLAISDGAYLRAGVLTVDQLANRIQLMSSFGGVGCNYPGFPQLC